MKRRKKAAGRIIIIIIITTFLLLAARIVNASTNVYVIALSLKVYLGTIQGARLLGIKNV